MAQLRATAFGAEATGSGCVLTGVGRGFGLDLGCSLTTVGTRTTVVVVVPALAWARAVFASSSADWLSFTRSWAASIASSYDAGLLELC